MKRLRQLSTFVFFALLASVSFSTSAIAENRDEVIFFFNDALGSAVAAVNESGELCWSEEYTGYGDKTINDDLVSPVGCGIVGEERGFTGHTEDVNSDLVYMQQRYYDPSIGRFLSIDPMDINPEVPTTYNRYAYANNNPYKYVDPDGRKVEFADTAGDETKAAWEELKNDDRSKLVIEALDSSEEVYTIASKPEAAPSFWERLFGSTDNRHGQYDPATRTIYITPGVQAKVLDLDAPGFFRPSRTISHTGLLFHEAGHALIHDRLGIGDGSDGRPRQSERYVHRIFDNPYNGFQRSGSGKFVFP